MRIFCLINLAFLFASHGFAVTLDEAFQAAINKNETAVQSREKVFQTDEQLNQAQSSIFPTLSFQGTYLVQPEPRDPIARQFFPEEQTTAQFTLKQPLFRGFREFAAIRQRRHNLRAEEQNRVGTLLALYQSVATAYLNVLSIEQDLKNLGEQKKIYGERIQQLQARIRRGESNSTEALTAQATEAGLEAEMRIVEANLATARENFRLVTTLPTDSELTDVSAQKQDNFLSLKPLQDYLSQIENRPDVKMAKERVEGSQEEVRVVRGAHWPTLDLLGNYYVKRPEGYLSDIKWDLQLQLTIPLFEGGIVQSQAREASSRNRERELELNQLRRKADTEITSLYEGLKNRADQLSALQRASEISEKNYQVLQRDFRRGLSRSIDVQLALTEFRVARRTYDQARFAARLDWIRLQIAAAQLPQGLQSALKDSY